MIIYIQRGKTKIKEEKLRKKSYTNIELLILKCVNKDIENITNKKDALDYTQLWDYYINRCVISKNYVVGLEEPYISDNFKLLGNVQKNLYNKCEQYKALNIKDEQLFNKLIEAQLYDVNGAKILYNNKKTKLKISDKYIVNIFKMTEKKNGTKVYDDWKEYENKNGVAIGTNVLAGQQLDKKHY